MKNNDFLNPFAQLSHQIEIRRRKAVLSRENKHLIVDTITIVMLIAVVIGVFGHFFSLRIVNGEDMYPALKDGDLTLTYKHTAEFKKNDVVFYTVDGREYIGRVVAKAGDYINFSDDGGFFVNGTEQTTEVVFPTYPPKGWEGDVTVPEKTVYILGDRRTQSTDSRTLGFIHVDDVSMKVIAFIRHKII